MMEFRQSGDGGSIGTGGLLLVVGLMVVWSLGGPPSSRAQSASSETVVDTTYTVRSGDTLFSIAQRFGTTVEAVQAANGLDGPTIQIGQTLQIPAGTSAPPSDVPPPDDAASGNAPASDTTSAEPDSAPDTPDDAAPDDAAPDDAAPDDDARDTPDRAASDASDAPESADPEQTPTEQTSSDRVDASTPPPLGTHPIRAGETLIDLALRLGTTADTLYALNDSTTAPLDDGHVVRLPPRFGPPTHVVQPGETPYGVAGEYGVSVRALLAANDLDDESLTPGQRLRIPGRDAPDLPPVGRLATPASAGPVVVYPPTFAGRLTASGTAYDPDDFVGSHPSLPYGSLVLLTHPDTGRHTFVRIVDRGPFDGDAIMDVSAAAARRLGVEDGSNHPVELRVVWSER